MRGVVYPRAGAFGEVYRGITRQGLERKGPEMERTFSGTWVEKHETLAVALNGFVCIMLRRDADRGRLDRLFSPVMNSVFPGDNSG